MSETRRHRLSRYGVAVLAVVLLGVLFRIPVLQHENTPAFLMCLVVLVSAWYGGLGPGLLTTALIVCASLDAPLTLWRGIRLAIFVGYGVITSALLEALHAARRRAEEAGRAKDDLLAALSHELRTPLTPVLAETSALLADPRTPDALRSVLELTRRNVALEARLIDDLLDVTRISRGELKLERETVDAHVAAQRAVDLCREQIDGRGLRLDLDLSAVSHHVHADPARLQQVLWNLVRNAAKFTPAGGLLSLRSHNENGPNSTRLLVEVIDTGIGIEPRDLARVFDAFRRSAAPGTQRFGGLGLGLAISRAVVDAHGGRLTVASAGKGQGTRFIVTLDTVPAAEPVAPAVSTGPPPASRASRILLVEDDVVTVRVLARLLRGSGFDVTTAGSVAEASDVAQGGGFDLVVSDIGLPDGTGWDLMPRLREHGICRGIALTGFGLDDDEQRSRDAGFLTHLTKPVDFPRLEEAIRQAAAV